MGRCVRVRTVSAPIRRRVSKRIEAGARAASSHLRWFRVAIRMSARPHIALPWARNATTFIRDGRLRWQHRNDGPAHWFRNSF
jgi:hypothetical protein